MKLDKMQFGRLIAYIAGIIQRGSIDATDLTVIDELIDIDVPAVETAIQVYPMNNNVEALMKYMAEGKSKIEAIKEYRAITGMGLKDSKDIVERYWNIKMSAETLKDKQLDALQRILDDCSPDLHQFNEEEIQIIKRWIEGFSV